MHKGLPLSVLHLSSLLFARVPIPICQGSHTAKVTRLVLVAVGTHDGALVEERHWHYGRGGTRQPLRIDPRNERVECDGVRACSGAPALRYQFILVDGRSRFTCAEVLLALRVLKYALLSTRFDEALEALLHGVFGRQLSVRVSVVHAWL